MGKLIFSIIFTAVAGYFTYHEAGTTISIILSMIVFSVLAQDILRQRNESQIKFLAKEIESQLEIISKLEQQLNSVESETKDLRIYSDRHEKWLDNIDRNVDYSQS
ncbi:hypothetical protein [Nitrosomonas aestuarii]|uniref:hypothetical protein n=1 Tax=Nitrosomonas aestuarii TaxID=52441 RepID=UPI000D309070|nr:hypothetical protein [Nitrosomonas aestuarii]PTN09694.1 hypothetical protein C8R11_12234 [Nitrosomonas aestuarii]